MFLTEEEVIELTGYRKPSAQSRWLWANGIKNYTNSQNRVIVVRSVVEGENLASDIVEPNFENVA